ncbi:MAG: acyl-CoA dehydrogenase family protein, partial [Hyphomicrobiaceae bacterium]
MNFELSETQQLLRDKAQTLAVSTIAPRAADVDVSEQYPWDNVSALTGAGFMGMTVPTSLGGRGLSYLDTTLVIEEMAKVCGITGRIVVEGNMGAIGAILAYGSQEQQTLAANLVLGGDKPAICITEPEAGSAATEMTTTAHKQGDSYILNGTKHWITGGGVSKLHLIFARLIEDGADRGIAGFLALRDEDEGLVVGRREYAMGLRGIPETQIHFRDLKLSADRIIIPPEGTKRGFAGLMNAYNSQRVGAATVALGIAQGAFEAAVAFVKQRHQFGRPIAEFQGLQWMLADAQIQLDAARMMIWRAAASAQQTPSGFPEPQLAAEAKVFASEMAVKVTNDA